jgi:hypothetical protein
MGDEGRARRENTSEELWTVRDEGIYVYTYICICKVVTVHIYIYIGQVY